MGGETDDETVATESAKPVKKKIKRSTHFNNDWMQNKNYAAWLKPTPGDPLSATCTVCSATIVIKHEGKTALDDHVKTKKHQNRVQVTRQTMAISSFMIKKDSEEDKIAVAELTSTYHGVRHGHSYLSTDCGNKVSAKIFSDSNIATKMSCGRTKSEALVENVLAPFSQERLAAELQKAQSFAVCSDASNSGHTKLFPYTVQYFCTSEGVKYGLLDFYEDPDESSEAIFNQIVSITENNGLSIKQISAYGADNASVNYGRHNSVFQKLRGVNPHIVKGNCKCHIINNSVKTANRVFSSSGCDVEAFVLKVYSEFSCSAKKVETLKEFCEFTSTKYREILRHVPTRWLSLLPAIQRILECWPALKSYFVSLGKDDCPSIVWTFVGGAADTDVDHTVAECILAFMHNVMQEFDSSIRKLESDSATVIDVYSVMNRLRNQLIARRTDRFYGSKARQIMKDLSPQQQDHFRSLVDRFFEKAVLYLEDKFDFKDQLLAHTGCLSLEGQSLQWSELALLLDKLALDVDEDKLYGDVITLNEVFDTIPKDLTLDRKWAYFFSKATESTELLKVVAFVFSIPVSNAYTERVFSHMENVWSDKRNRLSVAMVKSELQVRLNFKLSCAEFKSFIEKQPTLIAAAKGNAKYKWKISKEGATASTSKAQQ